MIFNLGSNTPTYPLFISGVPNATVTITNGKKTLSQVTDASGNTTFARLEKGTWDVTVTSGSESRTLSVEVSKNSGTLNVNAIPEFTYSGDYKIVNDSDSEISNAVKNWKIRFLTSGTLTFTALNGAADGIDVFCVGGGGNGSAHYNGGSGGAGGYTTTKKGVPVEKNYQYAITIGGATGKSSAFDVVAKGGESGIYGSEYTVVGGSGGSGGGADAAGGSDGSDGGGTSWYYGGKGQGTTTREFGESGATLYAGGGGGGPNAGGSGGGGAGASTWGEAKSGTANTGGGGGGVNEGTNGTGGSGIVIIRNAR